MLEAMGRDGRLDPLGHSPTLGVPPQDRHESLDLDGWRKSVIDEVPRLKVDGPRRRMRGARLGRDQVPKMRLHAAARGPR